MTLDPRTIAADIMCGNARSITVGEIWAHIGQAYDAAEIDASIADEVAELIAKTGIDLIWPDGSKNTELDAARVEIERRDAELAKVRAELAEKDAYGAQAARLRSALALALAGKRHLWDDAKKDWVPLGEWATTGGESSQSCPNCAPGYDCERGIYTPGGA